jgi:hypothetical protein
MNKLLLAPVVFAFALQTADCGDAQAAKPAPVPPQSGRSAILVDGNDGSGKLEKQADGTYLLRYPNGRADRVSANEVILLPDADSSVSPEPKLPKRPGVQ